MSIQGRARCCGTVDVHARVLAKLENCEDDNRCDNVATLTPHGQCAHPGCDALVIFDLSFILGCSATLPRRVAYEHLCTPRVQFASRFDVIGLR